MPLVLTRTGNTGAELVRPHKPVRPYPYRAEEVAFDNAEAPGVRLAGTLTLPQGNGPFPAAILISGSSPQDRDETVFGHKPFAVWADALTRRGIAVLRYDDRGTASSTGDFAAATSADFATDAASALNEATVFDDAAANAGDGGGGCGGCVGRGCGVHGFIQ